MQKKKVSLSSEDDAYNGYKDTLRGYAVKRLCGYTLFWISVGMILMFFMRYSLFSLCVIVFCLVLGYNLFNCKK